MFVYIDSIPPLALFLIACACRVIARHIDRIPLSRYPAVAGGLFMACYFFRCLSISTDSAYVFLSFIRSVISYAVVSSLVAVLLHGVSPLAWPIERKIRRSLQEARR